MILTKYYSEPWYENLLSHMRIRYYAIEARMIESFGFVTPDTDNRSAHSYTFASILRDTGSLFHSIIKKMIDETGKTYDDRIYGCLKFLEDHDPMIEKRTVAMYSNLKTLIPFKKEEDNLPTWWKAHIAVKHKEVIDYKQGSLENALNSLAANAILLTMCTRDRPNIFANVGTVYSEDSISEEKLLFPPQSHEE